MTRPSMVTTVADPVEDPEADLAKDLRLAHLHPRDWFKPFDNAEPGDPKRGFRR